MPNIRKRICVLASDITSNTVSLIIKGIIQKAYFYNYDVCVFTTLIKDSGKADYQYGEKNIFKLPNFDRFAGVIVVAESICIKGAVEEIEQELLKRCSCPVIVMDRSQSTFPSISINDEKTMENLVDHLIEVHGYKKINCLTGAKDDYHAQDRLEGYKKSLEKHGILVEEERYLYSDCLLDSAVEYAYRISHGDIEKPDAIVCYDDIVAVMMAKEFSIQGIEVPGDIAIVGFNSNDRGTKYIPCITSAIPPCKVHGENAVIMLHNEITNENNPIDQDLAGKLAIGKSCGCSRDLYYEERKLAQQNQEGCLTDHYFSSTYMEENLTSAATIEDCMVEINWYTYQLNKFKEFYISLIDDWDSHDRIMKDVNSLSIAANMQQGMMKEREYVKDGYTKKMVLHTKNKNGTAYVVREPFLATDMLPALYEERDYPTTFYFTPIHFKDRCLGYITINFGEEITTYDPYYHTWARNINNAIEIIRNQSELRYINEKLNKLALYDGLTGVYNRFGLNQEAKKMITDCLDSEEDLLLLVGDLDNLKKINDGFGHLEGDSAITTIARAFHWSTGGRGCLGRLGGDEFVMILHGKFDDKDIRQIKTKIKEYLLEYNKTSSKPYEVDVSVGHFCMKISGCLDDMEDIFDFFLNNADKEMYNTKKKKKYSRC
ncbi:MAG: diguanylate cyclase [bacterium]|nr:diguanylate cyclase [bacterium]